MTAGEFVVVVLVPVLQRQVAQRRRVRELQICEMPVQNLPVPRRQVDITGMKRNLPLYNLAPMILKPCAFKFTLLVHKEPFKAYSDNRDTSNVRIFLPFSIPTVQYGLP